MNGYTRIQRNRRLVVIASSLICCWIMYKIWSVSILLFSIFCALLAGISIFILKTFPGAFLRCVNWFFSNLIYRLQVSGLENLPGKSGALLVCRHVSFVDALIVQAAVSRPIRFLMYKPIYENPFVNLIARRMGAIPVAAEDGPKAMLQSLAAAREAINRGELVAIFAEGQLSRTGQLLPFSRGIEAIMRDTTAPIIPCYIDQIWGSIFSFEGGKFFRKVPKEIPYPVTVLFGRPLAPQSKAFEVRQKVMELGPEAFPLRQKQHKLLHSGFINEAKRHPFRPCMKDTSGKKLSCLGALTSAFLMARKFKNMLGADSKNVGVLLPPSVGAALTNLALLLCGKVPVNLNYTTGPDVMEICLKEAAITKIVTSRLVLDKLGIKIEPRHLLIDSFRDSFPFWKIFLYAVCSLLFPVSLIERICGSTARSDKDLATIIFSSGSTGIPKGVMLSHGNVSSNLESLYEILSLRKNDGILGILPFFHSFGFTACLWLPLLSGVRVTFHFNPTDADTIGMLVHQDKLTHLMSTPTFLLTYIRKCTPEQFKSLRYVVTGAEKLRERIMRAFYERFKITVHEGYGCTELSPVALINVPDFRSARIKQVGNKPGTAGHPIPGVACRILDQESLAPLMPNQQGILAVKGPNVMLGYLNAPEKTAEVIKDGWYLTGDISSMDEDGFVTILDRVSRFSKIGGEMVPHLGIEDAIHRIINEQEIICAVTGIPDERKGEKLVVLTVKKLDWKEVAAGLSAAGYPNLWIPKEENVHLVEKIPILGTGKLDLKAIKKTAESLSLKNA